MTMTVVFLVILRLLSLISLATDNFKMITISINLSKSSTCQLQLFVLLYSPTDSVHFAFFLRSQFFQVFLLNVLPVYSITQFCIIFSLCGRISFLRVTKSAFENSLTARAEACTSNKIIKASLCSRNITFTFQRVCHPYGVNLH